jgi:integrating conjugative element protein (TIGR03758 family)
MNEMNGIQRAAFESANSGVTAFAPETLAALILGILATVVMLWFGWVCVGSYRASAKAGIDNVGGQVLRGLFVMVVVLAITVF